MKTKQSIPSLTKADGSRAITPKDKADTLNNFFTSVSTIEDLNNIPSSTTSLVEEALSNIQITYETVLMQLKVLNPNKSPGHDKWHPYFLSELADIICVPLSILFNKSLKEGAHKSWMKAVITAIYKKELKSLPENYRPISITSVISKIMESIVRDAIVAHLMKHKLLTDDQHRFVPGKNCMTQLLLCMEDWTNLIERGETFDIQTLLKRLTQLHMNLERVGSFLCGRTQCACVEGVRSKWKKVISGIPQGSVISPILFIIFINDMSEEVKHSICKLFADDCKLYYRLNPACENKLQIDLTNLDFFYYAFLSRDDDNPRRDN